MPTPPPDSPEALAVELALIPGACRVPLRVGQVLLYRGHLAPGVFVAVRGELGLEGEARSRRTAPPPMVVPAAAALHERCAETITVLREGEAVFLPRTTVNADPEVQRRLAELLDVKPAARRNP